MFEINLTFYENLWKTKNYIPIFSGYLGKGLRSQSFLSNKFNQNFVEMVKLYFKPKKNKNDEPRLFFCIFVLWRLVPTTWYGDYST